MHAIAVMTKAVCVGEVTHDPAAITTALTSSYLTQINTRSHVNTRQICSDSFAELAYFCVGVTTTVRLKRYSIDPIPYQYFVAHKNVVTVSCS